MRVQRLYLLKAKGRTLYKIGITRQFWRRREEIEDSSGTRVIVLVCQRLFFAYFFEQLFHRIFNYRNRRFRGSGRTEWFKFWLPEVLLVEVLIYAIWLIQWAAIFGLFYLAIVKGYGLVKPYFGIE